MKAREICRSSFPLALALALAGALAGDAGAQSIGVFFDLGATDCDRTHGAYSPGTLYVCALLGGASAGGVSGAAFRVDGIPPAWAPAAMPNPAALYAFGDPVSGGCFIAFQLCQTGDGHAVILYSISYWVTDPLQDVYIQVGPAPDLYGCNCCMLYESLCDPPNYTSLCVPGGTAIVNGPPCTVQVEPATWSRIKRMYGGAGR